MAKRTGKNCSSAASDNVFVIKVPADSKTIIVISPKVTTPYIKCEKVAESDGANENNSRVLKADELLSHIKSNANSDDGEEDFNFGI